MYTVSILIDGEGYQTICEVETINEARSEVEHQKQMDSSQNEENIYAIFCDGREVW